MGPQGLTAAGLMNARSLERLKTGEQFDPLPSTKGNWIDTLLGTAGTIGKGVDQWQAGNTQNEQNDLIRQLLEQAMRRGQVPQVPGTGMPGTQPIMPPPMSPYPGTPPFVAPTPGLPPGWLTSGMAT
jgi:hypothetical protein